MNAKQLRTEIQSLTNEIKAFRAQIEAKGADAPSTDVERLRNMIDAVAQKNADLQRLDLVDSIDAQFKPELPQDAGRKGNISIGRELIESKSYRDAAEAKRFDGFVVESKNLITTAMVGTIESRAPQLPLQYNLELLDIISRGNTTSTAVRMPVLQAVVDATAPVAEGALYPESTFTWAQQDFRAEKVGTFVQVTEEVLADAPLVVSLMDVTLRNMLRNEIARQVLIGAGSGSSELLGISNTTGIQSRVHKVSGRGWTADDTLEQTVLRAIFDIVAAGGKPDAIVASPFDTEKLVFSRLNGNVYGAYDPTVNRFYNLPVVISPELTAGTIIVGDFKNGAMLLDRNEGEVRYAEPNDYALRGKKAMIASARAMLLVSNAAAFEKITGV